MRLQFSGKEHKLCQSERRAFAEATEIISLFVSEPTPKRSKGSEQLGLGGAQKEPEQYIMRDVKWQSVQLFIPWQGMKWVAEENR